MSPSGSSKWIGIVLIWLIVIAFGAAVAFKLILKPDQKRKLEKITSAKSQYDAQITINLDGFSGYSVLRSEVFREELKASRIRLILKDDQADYEKRIQDLKSGKCEFAVFTVDSLISSSARLGDWPGTMVLAIDESFGADAMVAYKKGVPNLNSLDNPEARIVLTPNSPSEFMARIVRAHFTLTNLPSDYFVPAEGSAKVYEKFASADPAEKKAYILWEPDVSKALEKEGSHTLVDSSKIKGYIFDVLVVQREFLAEHEEIVGKVMEAYFRAVYYYRDSMEELVLKDAKAQGSPLSQDQAKAVVKGIRWKNTVENYAHFGLLGRDDAKGLDYMEDVIEKIMSVLVQTNAFKSDPLDRNYSKLFYNQMLAKLKRDQFHPGKKINLLGQEMGGGDVENVRGEEVLSPLTDEEWESLVAVGKMTLRPISFGRGKSEMNFQSQRDLQELAEKIKSWPQYYLLVVGHARKEGDVALNKQLAGRRAEAVRDFLVSNCNVDPVRIKAREAQVFKRGGEGQSVSFVVGEKPY